MKAAATVSEMRYARSGDTSVAYQVAVGRGSHELKGVPGEQQLFAVRTCDSRRPAAEPVWPDPVEAAP